jgi:hypothetical protein
VAKKSELAKPKRTSGPRAPAGKHALTVIIDENLIKRAKIAAIENSTNVSRVTEELLDGWLSGAFKLRR